MVQKYYAVKEGRKSGVYESWNAAKKQISGFPNAVFKSFSNYEEAIEYVNVKTNTVTEKNFEGKTIDAYVDGSFSDLVNCYAYGIVFVDGKNAIHQTGGIGKSNSLISMRNVAGELLGAIVAIKWAITEGFEQVRIHYDYAGIEKWVTKEWRAKKDGTQKYVQQIDDLNQKIDIQFVKVKAHSGVDFNEMADELARQAILKHGKVEHGVSNELHGTSSKRDYQEDSTSLYDDLFSKIMSEEQVPNGKRNFSVKMLNWEIDTKKSEKFIKAVWKREKRKISDIKTIGIILDLDRKTLNWEIEDTSGTIYKYEYKIGGE